MSLYRSIAYFAQSDIEYRISGIKAGLSNAGDCMIFEGK